MIPGSDCPASAPRRPQARRSSRRASSGRSSRRWPRARGSPASGSGGDDGINRGDERRRPQRVRLFRRPPSPRRPRRPAPPLSTRGRKPPLSPRLDDGRRALSPPGSPPPGSSASGERIGRSSPSRLVDFPIRVPWGAIRAGSSQCRSTRSYRQRASPATSCKTAAPPPSFVSAPLQRGAMKPAAAPGPRVVVAASPTPRPSISASSSLHGRARRRSLVLAQTRPRSGPLPRRARPAPRRRPPRPFEASRRPPTPMPPPFSASAPDDVVFSAAKLILRPTGRRQRDDLFPMAGGRERGYSIPTARPRITCLARDEAWHRPTLFAGVPALHHPRCWLIPSWARAPGRAAALPHPGRRGTFQSRSASPARRLIGVDILDGIGSRPECCTSSYPGQSRRHRRRHAGRPGTKFSSTASSTRTGTNAAGRRQQRARWSRLQRRRRIT